MLLEVPDEAVADREEDGQGDQAIPERGILGRHRVHGLLDLVVEDVGGERVLAQGPEEAELERGDVAERDEAGVDRQGEARRRTGRRGC